MGNDTVTFTKFPNINSLGMDGFTVNSVKIEYYKQPKPKKFDSLEEIDKFLDTYTISRMKHETINAHIQN
jgi:hypothetical protein